MGSSGWRGLQEAWLALCVALAAIVLYLPSVGFGFILDWDDAAYVTENPYIRELSWANLQALFSRDFVSNYAPLHLLSYMLEYPFWGLDPAGYHLVNLLLHAVNAALLWFLLRRLCGDPRLALFVALLFALHPVNVENVAWIAERKSLLSATFMVLAALGYLRYRDQGGGWWLAGTLLLYAAAMLSKSIAVVLAPLMLLHEWLLAQRPRRWWPLLPLFAVAIGGSIPTLLVHIDNEAIATQGLDAATLLGKVYPTVVTTFGRYLLLLVWPFGQSGFYDLPLQPGWLAPPVVAAVVGWVVASFVLLRWGSNPVRFWYLWFWVALGPVSNIIPLNTFYADRYMYLPAIGLFMLAGIGLRRLAQRLPAPALRREALAVIGVLLALLLAPITSARLEVWRDEISFWEDTARAAPQQYKPRINLGAAYERAGRLEEAMAEYRAAARIWMNPQVVRNMQAVRFKLQQQAEAR